MAPSTFRTKSQFLGLALGTLCYLVPPSMSLLGPPPLAISTSMPPACAPCKPIPLPLSFLLYFPVSSSCLDNCDKLIASTLTQPPFSTEPWSCSVIPSHSIWWSSVPPSVPPTPPFPDWQLLASWTRYVSPLFPLSPSPSQCLRKDHLF